jgi:glycosyltransferase involved in cell wall biosynthesis
VVIAPTYNNSATLADVLGRIQALKLPILVINDGSTDSTANLLGGLAEPGAVTVLTHLTNQGKAAALHTGFTAAIAAGFTHAATIDTDGQHNPEEIVALLDAARCWPDALIVGRRDQTADGYPARSRIGRRVSNFLVRVESGAKVEDSQCGLRIYPLGLVQSIKCRVGHYGFETEVITRAAWAGCQVIEVPVTCRYLPIERRISHFRPWVDSFRGVAMHFFLLARAICPVFPPPRWPAGRRGAGGRRWSPQGTKTPPPPPPDQANEPPGRS